MAQAKPVDVFAEPNNENSTHELVVVGPKNEKIGLRLPRLFGDVRIAPSRSYTQEGGSRGGRYSAGSSTLAEIEQRDFTGGRGWDDFAQNPLGFYDSHMMLSSIPGQIHAAPQYNFMQGHRNENRYLPVPYNVGWISLSNGSTLFVESQFTVATLAGSGTYNGSKIYLKIRRKGDPKGNLTVELCTTSAGDPDTVLKTVTIDKDDITDVASLWQVFELSAVEALTHGTDYHIKVYGNTADSARNCWEIGVDNAGADSQQSSDGSTWSSASFSIYYRIVDDRGDGRFFQFTFEDAWYAAWADNAGTATSLYLVGDKGIATSATSTVITDTNSGSWSTWTTNRWTDAYSKIIRGTGKGQVRKIASNTATTFTVTKAYDVTPDNTSVYVIFGTWWCVDVSPSSGDQFDTQITGVVVANDQVFFACSTGQVVYRMRFNSATPAHQYKDDGEATSLADIIYLHNDPIDGPKIIMVRNDNVTSQRSGVPSWGNDLAWSTAKQVGDTHRVVTSLVAHENMLYAFKPDGIWYQYSGADRWNRQPTQLQSLPHERNGIDAVSFNKYLYFPYAGFSLEEMLGERLNDIGPWQRAGLPENRKGEVISLAPILDFLGVAIDAGTAGYSSVFYYDGDGYHEVYRHDELGASIKELRIQSVENSAPRMWTSVGSDAVFQVLPETTFNAKQDSGHFYHDDAEIITGYFDVDQARLYKMIRALYLAYENTATGRSIEVLYQIDDNVGNPTASTWKYLGSYRAGGSDEKELLRGGVRRIRFRIRLLTDTAIQGVRLLSLVITLFTRLPSKLTFLVSATVGEGLGTRQERVGLKAGEVYDQLASLSDVANTVKLQSMLPFLDGATVTMQEPVPIPSELEIEGDPAIHKTPEWSGRIDVTMVVA